METENMRLVSVFIGARFNLNLVDGNREDKPEIDALQLCG
jgi:hypothetical protein